MTTTKPCACGRDGCVAVRKRGQSSGKWARQKYANPACARWHKNMTDPRMQQARLKAAAQTLRRHELQVDPEAGALITPVEWLSMPSVRIRLQRLAQGVRL